MDLGRLTAGDPIFEEIVVPALEELECVPGLVSQYPDVECCSCEVSEDEWMFERGQEIWGGKTSSINLKT